MMQRTSTTPFVTTTTTTLLGVFLLYLMAQKLESSTAFVVVPVSTRSPPVVHYVAALHYRRGGSDDEWYSPPPTPTALQPRVVETTSPPAKALQTSITSLDELHAILNDPTDTRLVIVKFYASWCKTCAMLGMKMDKLAAEYADWVDTTTTTTTKTTKLGHVRIVNVEYGTARDVCRHYEIERLPTIHMYMPTSGSSSMERVQDFSCNSKQFQRVKDLTIGYIQQQQYQATRKQHSIEEEVDIDDPTFNAKLDAGRAMIQSAMTSTSD